MPIGSTPQEASDAAYGQVLNANPVTRNGRLAQLARASVLHTEGQRFKSSTAHHEPTDDEQSVPIPSIGAVKGVMERYPSYHPRDYPAGVSDFVKTFPPERRNEVLAAIVELQLRGKAEEEWVGQQVQGMLELPKILYKYVPCKSLDYGLPTAVRATQPSSLNDIMEGNIRTSMQGRTDRDEWYARLSEKLKEIFFDDALSDDEMERRKKVYGDPRVSTIIREYLSRFVGVVSFSSDPLIPTMWAHYAKNSGFVVGYKASEIRALGVALKRVLYMELAPVYHPTRDNIVRLQFVDEERRQQNARAGGESGIPLIGSDADLLELRRDWKELAKALFVKGETWESEKEVRLLVDLRDTRPLNKKDENGFEKHVLDVPAEAIEEVYVGFNTPGTAVDRIRQVVGVGDGKWKLMYTDSHAYRMQVTVTGVENRTK